MVVSLGSVTSGAILAETGDEVGGYEETTIDEGSREKCSRQSRRHVWDVVWKKSSNDDEQ